MIKLLLLFCCLYVGYGAKPLVPAHVGIVDQQLPNGDLSEMVSIDLMKEDEDIKMVALLRFHLIEGIVHINGHRVLHSVVNQVGMFIHITETVRGLQKAPRLAPAMFRVLVQESTGSNGLKRLATEFEIMEIEGREAFQVDVKQLTWEGSNRLPMTTISFEDSILNEREYEDDHVAYAKGFDPKRHRGHKKHHKHGKHCHWPHHHDKHHHHKHEHHKHHEHPHPHHHHHHHPPHHCWWNRLSLWHKVLIVISAALFLMSLVIATVLCCRRRRALKVMRQHRNVAVETPPTMEGKGCDNGGLDMKAQEEQTHFHMSEIIEPVVVDDKKDLIAQVD